MIVFLLYICIFFTCMIPWSIQSRTVTKTKTQRRQQFTRCLLYVIYQSTIHQFGILTEQKTTTTDIHTSHSLHPIGHFGVWNYMNSSDNATTIHSHINNHLRLLFLLMNCVRRIYHHITSIDWRDNLSDSFFLTRYTLQNFGTPQIEKHQSFSRYINQKINY